MWPRQHHDHQSPSHAPYQLKSLCVGDNELVSSIGYATGHDDTALAWREGLVCANCSGTTTTTTTTTTMVAASTSTTLLVQLVFGGLAPDMQGS